MQAECVKFACVDERYHEAACTELYESPDLLSETFISLGVTMGLLGYF